MTALKKRINHGNAKAKARGRSHRKILGAAQESDIGKELKKDIERLYK